MAPSKVHQRTVAWLEPIEAYRRMRAFHPALLDGSGAHPEARTSILGLGPTRTASLRGDELHLHGEPTRHGEPLSLLRALWQEQTLGRQAGFVGGWIGYLGYEFARAIEPTLPPPKEPAATPDAWFRFFPDGAIFERASKTVRLMAVDADRAKAKARLAQYARAWATPAPPPEDVAVDGDWKTSLDQAAFEEAVTALKERIRNGDLFQANIATRFSTPCAARPDVLFQRLAAANPSPFMALVEADDHAIVSCSPEQLFQLDGDRIATRPIAGTRPRHADPARDAKLEAELRNDAKERAEHTMLVDLLRNDIAKVSKPGTTQVAEAMSVERYRHVMHLVSRVEGRIRHDADVVDCIAALFPGGTITGAPKHRACLRIHEAEGVPRGPYTGSAGFVSMGGDAHFNILIRTLVLHAGQATVHAGSGIVADSDPAREWHEAGTKAQALLEAASAPSAGGGSRLGEVTTHGSWSQPTPRAGPAARVLLVDNYDSFVHNLADYCAAAGATVQVIRNDASLDQALADFGPTHVILGPGPGWPAESGITGDAAVHLVGRLPILGVCLGHQALAEAHGGTVHVGPPVHGKTSPIHHAGDRLLAHLPTPFAATRYHSLHVTPPADWQVTARLEDGMVMAMKHPEHPVWGLQFHPESFCTDGGLEIIQRFLEA